MVLDIWEEQWLGLDLYRSSRSGIKRWKLRKWVTLSWAAQWVPQRFDTLHRPPKVKSGSDCSPASSGRTHINRALLGLYFHQQHPVWFRRSEGRVRLDIGHWGIAIEQWNSLLFMMIAVLCNHIHYSITDPPAIDRTHMYWFPVNYCLTRAPSGSPFLGPCRCRMWN